jgi:hypothetical protein
MSMEERGTVTLLPVEEIVDPYHGPPWSGLHRFMADNFHIKSYTQFSLLELLLVLVRGWAMSWARAIVTMLCLEKCIEYGT